MISDTAPLPPAPSLTSAVVIATYRRPDHIRSCLEHLSTQTRQPDEIVVVDASPDTRTRQVVVNTFPTVTYLRNKKGPGFTATSRAVGVTASTSDIIVFIDDDAYAHPDWLEQLMARYVEPVIAAVGGRARNFSPGEENDGLGQVGRLLPNGTLTGFFATDTGRDVDVDHLLGANMSVRRSVLESLGGIHDYYPGTCLREETDIALRIRRAGFRLVYTPTAVVDHVAGPYAKGQRFDTRYTYYGFRNHVVLLARTLGFADPHLRHFAVTAATEIGRDLKSSVHALTANDRRSRQAKERGVVGGLLRGGAKSVGLVMGSVAAVRYRLSEGPVPASAGAHPEAEG